MRASVFLVALVLSVLGASSLGRPAYADGNSDVGAISFEVLDRHKRGVADVTFTVTLKGADQTATTGGDQPTDSELAAAARKGDAEVDALKDRYASRAVLVDLPLANATVTPDLPGAKPFTIALTTAQPAWSVSITVDVKTKRIIGAPRIIVDAALAAERPMAAHPPQPATAATATVTSPTAPSPTAPGPGSVTSPTATPKVASQAATAPTPIKNGDASAVRSPARPADTGSPPGRAASSPGLDPHRQRYLGIGYKLGDGIGFAGADLIVSPVSHLTLDLFASYLSVTASDGSSGGTIALAPAIQVHLFDGWRSSPYVALGVQYVSITVGGATATGTGAFGNIGWDFRFTNGFGILAGIGVQEFQATASNGGTMVTVGSNGPAFNLELGLRYMLL